MLRYLPILLIALAGCISETAKITPKAHRVVKSPKLASAPIMSMLSSDNVDNIAPAPSWHITWGWPCASPTNLPQPNIEFDLEKRDDMTSDWFLYTRTNQPPVAFEATNGQGYFRVGVHYIDPDNGPFYDYSDACTNTPGQ